MLRVSGLAGRTYDLAVRTPGGVRRVRVLIPGPGDKMDGYADADVRVTRAP
jgi:hypothetical protein